MATKLTGHDFVLPGQPPMKPLNETDSDTFDIRSQAEYQDISTEMDFLGGDSGMQDEKFPQPRKLKFLNE
jgi:hypothetical protein